MAKPKRRRGEERGSRSPIRVPDVAVPLGREEGRPALFPGVALAAGILLFLFLLRFAVDVLLWVLVLALFALVLHLFLDWLARTELLSAPWLLVIALTVGAAIWMLWPESGFQKGLDVTRYRPTPFLRALERAEERGLTRRALVGAPAPAGAREQTTGTAAASPPSEPVSPDSGLGFAFGSGPIRVTGAAASRIGEPVTLAAVVTTQDRTQAGSVQFFDGSVLLGEAALEPAGTAARAVFTAVGLSVGTHRITARYAGTTSSALVHTVAGR